MEKQTKRNSYLSKELPIYEVVTDLNVDTRATMSVINNLKDEVLSYDNLKKEANKQPLLGQGYLVELSKKRIENAKKLLLPKLQGLKKQINEIYSTINGNNYTENMVMAIEKFDEFVAKEYGIYF